MSITSHSNNHVCVCVCVCVCGENFEDLLSWQLSCIQYSIVNYSHHAVHHIPRIYSTFN